MNKIFFSSIIIFLYLFFFSKFAGASTIKNIEELEIVSYISIQPNELFKRLDIKGLYNYPELNLVLQQFQNNAEDPDSGFFGLNFSNKIKAYLFFYDKSKYPEFLIKLPVADFDILNAVFQYFSAQSYQIEPFNENDTEKFLIKKIDSNEDKHKIPAFLFNNDFYILVDFLSFSKIKVDGDKFGVESETKPHRFKRAFNMLEKLKEKNFENENFPDDISNAKEKSFIYAFNKSAIPYLEKILGTNIAERLKIDTESLTNNFITFSTGADFLEVLNFEFKKKIEIAKMPRININSSSSYLVNKNIFAYFSFAVNNENIIEYLKKNDFISLPGVKHYLLSVAAQLSGDISGYAVKNLDKQKLSETEDLTFSKILLNNYSPVLFFKCADLKNISSSLKSLSELYPDNFSIKHLKDDSMYIIQKNEINNLPVDLFFSYLSGEQEKYFAVTTDKTELRGIISNFRNITTLMKKNENNIFNYFLQNKFNIMDIDNGFCFFNISAFFGELKKIEALNPLQIKLADYLSEKLENWFTYTTYFKGFNKNRHIIKSKNLFSIGGLYGILKKQ